MSTNSRVDVLKGMDVYTADGVRLGRVGGVYGPAPDADTDSPLAPGVAQPEESGTQVRPEALDLDITGTTRPLAGTQPAQADLGVDPQPRDAADLASLADAGTDYRRLGEAGDTVGQGPERAGLGDLEGFFKVSTGLDSPDLYLRLSVVEEVVDVSVTLTLNHGELKAGDWQRPSRG